MTTFNPLTKHFRQPSIFLKLPSRGKFYPEGSINLPASGELAVYPMTIKDEILLKTPDALMNGEGMSSMISSCCPSIVSPWDIPLVDLDAILIAIRLASYGNAMDINSKCAHCQEPNEHTIDLRVVLDNLNAITKYNTAIELNGLLFNLKPQTYKDLNQSGKITFEQQRLLSVVTNSELSEEDKRAQFQEIFNSLTNMNINTLVTCITSIVTEDGTAVSDPELITEFLNKADRKTYDGVKEIISEAVGANVIDPVEVECTECKQKYKVKLEFNPTTFFG